MHQNNYGIVTFIGNLHAVTKMLISIIISTLIYFFVPAEPRSLSGIVICWNSFSTLMILFSWITFFSISTQQIRQQSKVQDESRIIIFVLILFATLASLTAVFLILTSKANNIQLINAIAGMLLSWILIHTIFASRYAHMYYSDDSENENIHAAGLAFPGDKKPDYLDFAYFAFVVGMTFQVSDVQVISKRFRRLLLLHGFISFLFNTIIVALTINVIAGFRGR